ncbi:transcriptional regulator [Pseudomonas sp. PA15(2017)]|uniref:ogr/Delta-like zinc finger family protein n=1 Tax=Pseudomonas sp. PA15(2017) TaxID=1932111 RepID=UPI00095C3E7A|nr:ogr/Delta-like zinc finger family protein [Pseudomonas sp. PA15(2017)]OLU22494.1 transcriptional regulator [Pseudomonas sp. PA15(2017)]
MSIYKLVCPACGNPVRIRSSEGQSPLFRTMYGQCTYVPCGYNIVGSLNWDYGLNASGMDKPRITLPLAPSVVKRQAHKDCRLKKDQLDLLDALEEAV